MKRATDRVRQHNRVTSQQVVLVIGPIASGKSTLSAALAGRLRAAGHRVAVLDIDETVADVGGFVGLEPEEWHRAQRVFGDLIGAWAREGYTVVAHGPLFEPEEDARAVRAVPATVPIRRVHLDCTFAVALARVAGDRADRPMSSDIEFLRSTYDDFSRLRPHMLRADATLDTTAATPLELTDRLASVLL